MNDNELEHDIHDDLAVEIVDIDEAQTPTPEQPQQGASLSQPKQSPLAPRFSLQQRRKQMLVTTSVVVLLLLVFVGSYAPTRTFVLSSVFPPPIPTVPLLPGADLFYVSANPPWGQLFIDDTPIRHLPDISVDKPLRLQRGRHVLEWRAAPFRSQRCIVSVPQLFRTDTCVLNTLNGLSSNTSASLITFSVSLTGLADEQRTSLVQTIQEALNAEQSVDTVQPGERYAIPDNKRQFAVATQPLQAILHFHLNTNINTNVFCIDSIFGMPNQSCMFDGQDCRLLCSLPHFVLERAVPTPTWTAYGIVRSSWDYATLDGHPVAQDQPASTGDGSLDEHLMSFAISWDGTHWHATTMFTTAVGAVPNEGGPTCFPAVDNFMSYGTLTPTLTNGASYSVQYVAGAVHAAGCLVTLSVLTDSTPTTTAPTFGVMAVAYALQRFGVFVAINDTAHKLWPNMPLADIYEQGIAHQLATLKNTSGLSMKASYG